MRLGLLALAALVSVSAFDSANAQRSRERDDPRDRSYGDRAFERPRYGWCAEYNIRGGASNCYFRTYEQCRAAISGVGGFCRPNYFAR